MATSGDPFLPPTAVVLGVLQSSAPYADEAEKEACMKLVDELTAEEQEMAARTSYAYWVASTTGLFSAGSDLDPVVVKQAMAMREARRHLVGEDGDHEKAFKRLRETCQDRKERRVDVFRTCFREDVEHESEEGSKIAKKYRDLLWDDMQKQAMVVRGMDRDLHAIVVKFPRLASDTTQEPFFAAQTYIAERVIATAEILSVGKLEKVTAIFDFAHYSRKNAPPRSAIKEVIRVLQRNYPERLKILLIMNASLAMRVLFKILRPFLSPATREKVRLVSKDELEPLVADGHVETVTSPVDLERFFTTPFHQLYEQPPLPDGNDE